MEASVSGERASANGPQQPHGDCQNPVTPNTVSLGLTFSCTSLPPILRGTQVALCIASLLQLLVACTFTLVDVSHIDVNYLYFSSDIALMVVNVFLFVCSITGLVAANGRFRILLGVLILLSVFVLIPTCLLLRFLFNCKKLLESDEGDLYPSPIWECEHGDDNDWEYGKTLSGYTNSRYLGMLANLAFNIVASFGSCFCSMVMLVASLKFG
jgi:hypothetical protein